MQDKIDEQLWELQKAVNRYKAIDPLSHMVLYAVSWYICSGKATRAFEEAFCEFDSENFTDLIKKCLNGDRSNDGIIKTCKRIFRM